MEKGIREFTRKVLMMDREIEAYCIVPECKEGQTAEDDKIYLRHWAVIPRQTHSLNVGIVEREGQEFPDTDALISRLKNIPIGVVTADCVPILLHAPDIGTVAAAHAGWKGTIGGILDYVLDEMERLGADMSKMKAIFGPSISKDVYEVDRSLGRRFIDAGFGDYVSWPTGRDGKPHLDLQGVNMERLTRRGVKEENIWLNGECTYSSDGFHSYRRDAKKAGRQLTAIVMR